LFHIRKFSVVFISKTAAIDTAIPACVNPTVDQQSFDTQAYTDIYGNAPTAGFRSGLENEFSPVWIVHLNGYWALTGRPGLEPVTITTYEKCMVIINALTDNVILADFPTLE
jgi:hypothetical protein